MLLKAALISLICALSLANGRWIVQRTPVDIAVRNANGLSEDQTLAAVRGSLYKAMLSERRLPVPDTTNIGSSDSDDKDDSVSFESSPPTAARNYNGSVAFGASFNDRLLFSL